MICIENTDYAIGIAANDEDKPVAIILATDSIEHGSEFMMASTEACLDGGNLVLTGNDATITLLALQPSILDCINLSLPLVIIDSATKAEIELHVAMKAEA